MADSAVAITAGAGTNIDVRTVENGDKRQVVVIGADEVSANIADVTAAYGLAVDVKRRAPVSTAHLITAGSTNATSIKASAGTLRSVHVFNNATYPIYAKFHNTAGAPTAGTGVVLTVGVQAGTQRDFVLPGGGRSFATGIGLSVVKLVADNDATAVLASDASIEVSYE